ncbi:glycosyltransferase [Vibrio sp. HN007]|uniref:glycosyltransferase n=1 Tax=Vibrio iocasae TaxID=3098914 RepID=UPI0035D4F12F
MDNSTQKSARSSEKPSNILFVHYGDNWIRGSETCLLNLVKSLDQDKFRPIVWTNNMSLQDRLQGIAPCTLSSFSFLANELTPDAGFCDWLKQISNAVKLIRQHNIDLIHVNSGAPCQWMVIASYLTKVPMVTQLHSDYSWKDRVTLGLHIAPMLITVSRAISKNLRREGVTSEKLRVISNGCAQPRNNHAVLDVKRKLGLTSSDVLLVSVGSLIHRKGMDTLIKAVHSLKEETRQYHLLIVGEGEERANLEALCQKLGIENRIHFVGEQSNVYQWLRGGTDIFVSGARSEAFGLVFVEAAFASVPVIAPERDGIPEVLSNNHSALLYNEDTELPHLIKRLADTPRLQQRLSITAKQNAENEFSIQANTQAFERLYMEILNTPEKARPRMASLLHPLSYAIFGGVLRLLKKKMRSSFTIREITS